MPPRYFKHGELPLVLLALLADTPRHGYDLMAELNRLFGPRYRASPGSIYPAIEALQAEGLLVGEAIDERVVYRTTSSGAQALEDRAEVLAALELRVGVQLGGESLDAVLNRFKARILPLGGRVDPAEVERLLARVAVDIELLSPARPTPRSTHAR